MGIFHYFGQKLFFPRLKYLQCSSNIFSIGNKNLSDYKRVTELTTLCCVKKDLGFILNVEIKISVFDLR